MELLVLAMVRQPSVTTAARSMLGRFLRGHGVTIRITEVEAYAGPLDPASHAYTRTPRSEIMYGPPSRLYVYRIHGHFCANVVTGPDGEASAVLLRAGEVVDGLDVALLRRGEHIAPARLARGPGNLAKALGITMDDLGVDLDAPRSRGVRFVTPDEVDGQIANPVPISSGPRVGVRRNADVAWRYWITDDPTVSAYRRHPRAD
ncbi:DNA-3-methyladenine glycosylase [Gordonia sputi]